MRLFFDLSIPSLRGTILDILGADFEQPIGQPDLPSMITPAPVITAPLNNATVRVALSLALAVQQPTTPNVPVTGVEFQVRTGLLGLGLTSTDIDTTGQANIYQAIVPSLVLTPLTTYWIRARFLGANQLTSLWSDEVQISGVVI